jgi:hypothetical protein
MVVFLNQQLAVLSIDWLLFQKKPNDCTQCSSHEDLEQKGSMIHPVWLYDTNTFLADNMQMRPRYLMQSLLEDVVLEHLFHLTRAIIGTCPHLFVASLIHKWYKLDLTRVIMVRSQWPACVKWIVCSRPHNPRSDDGRNEKLVGPSNGAEEQNGWCGYSKGLLFHDKTELRMVTIFWAHSPHIFFSVFSYL